MFRECFMNFFAVKSYGNVHDKLQPDENLGKLNRGAASHRSPPGAASVTGPE